MKKKISLLICMLIAVLSFTACGSKGSTVEDFDTGSAEEVIDFLIGYCTSADDATFQQWYDMDEFAINTQLTAAGLPFDAEGFVGALQSWQAGVEECGAYQSHGDFKYEVTNGSLKVTTDAKFEKRDATLTFIFDENNKMESMTVDAKFATSEILEKAGLNTLLGMGTVFCVLIFISLLISLFKYIPDIQNAFANKGKNKTVVSEETKVEQAAPVVVQAVADDSELIAVISAAIAASEGTSTDGFVVRSIRRRPSNKWN